MNKNNVLTLVIVFVLGLLIGGAATAFIMHTGRSAKPEETQIEATQTEGQGQDNETVTVAGNNTETPPETPEEPEEPETPEEPEEPAAPEEPAEPEEPEDPSMPEEVPQYPEYMQEQRSVARTDQLTQKNEKGNLIVDELPGNAIMIVALGDSMWDNFREEDGIAAQLSAFNDDFEIYNLAFGAATASRLENDSHDTDKKTLTTLVDICCKHEGNVVPESYSRNAIEKANFLRTNYYILAYGINDFFEGKPIWNPYFSPDKTCYSGALTYAIQELKKTYPDCRVVVVSPTYVNGNPKNNYGTVDDYKKAAAQVASENNALYFDPVPVLGMTTENANDFLVDGIHLNAEARAKYAEALGRFILADWNR